MIYREWLCPPSVEELEVLPYLITKGGCRLFPPSGLLISTTKEVPPLHRVPTDLTCLTFSPTFDLTRASSFLYAKVLYYRALSHKEALTGQENTCITQPSSPRAIGSTQNDDIFTIAIGDLQ